MDKRDKRPDFGKDLALLSDNVDVAVGDVLKVLRQKKPPSDPTAAIQKEAPKVQESPPPNSVAEPAEPEKPAGEDSSRKLRAVNRSRLKPVIEYEAPRKNVTLRIRIDTNELLTEAAHWQGAKRKSPSTRQDIAQEALEDWFRKHGYSTARDANESD